VYEYITWEIALLPGENLQIWRQKKTVFILQKDVVDLEEKAWQKIKASQSEFT